MNLNEMKEVICSACKENVLVNFYYSGTDISEEKDHWNGHDYFSAKVNAQAMCPNCGHTIYKTYCHEIAPELIVKLALGKVDV